MIVVFLFLRNIRSTFIIALSIPISVVTTFILIYFKDMTLNAMSMGGLALGVGMLVDNSIVVLENIYRHFALGEERNAAADLGATEVGTPIFASTLTTVAVFLPIAFTTGLAGRIFRELAWTVSFSLFASLFVALTIVPMLTSKVLTLKERELRVEERLKRTKEAYSKIIEYSLNHRFKIILGAFLFFAFSMFLTTMIGKEFIEQSDANEIIINLEMPKGTSLKETNRVMSMFEKETLKMPEVKNFFIMMGYEEEMVDAGSLGEEQGSNTGFIVVSLVDESERDKNINEIMDDLRNMANIPGLKMKFQETMGAILGMGSPIQIKIFGNDLDVLAGLSDKVFATIKDIPGLVDLNATTLSGKPELQINFDRDKLADFNLNVESVSDTIKTSLQGDIPTQFREAGEEYGIRVRLHEKYREKAEDLGSLLISLIDGRQVRLNEIATVVNKMGPSKIDRENQKRYVTITGDTSGNCFWRRVAIGHIQA
jgi:HAE1 family hydrophobic/amphiphilic exporter-1